MNQQDKDNITKRAVEKLVQPFPAQIEIAFSVDIKELENHL